MQALHPEWVARRDGLGGRNRQGWGKQRRPDRRDGTDGMNADLVSRVNKEYENDTSMSYWERQAVTLAVPVARRQAEKMITFLALALLFQDPPSLSVCGQLEAAETAARQIEAAALTEAVTLAVLDVQLSRAVLDLGEVAPPRLVQNAQGIKYRADALSVIATDGAALAEQLAAIRAAVCDQSPRSPIA